MLTAVWKINEATLQVPGESPAMLRESVKDGNWSPLPQTRAVRKFEFPSFFSVHVVRQKTRSVSRNNPKMGKEFEKKNRYEYMENRITLLYTGSNTTLLIKCAPYK